MTQLENLKDYSDAAGQHKKGARRFASPRRRRELIDQGLAREFPTRAAERKQRAAREKANG